MSDPTQVFNEPRAPMVKPARRRSWWQRVRERMSGSMHPVGTMAAPIATHYEKTEDERFKEQRGFSMATTPLPWSSDIAEHNKEIDKEYWEEIDRRKKAYDEGQYRPRFLLVPPDGATDVQWLHYERITSGRYRPTAEDINWDLEMSMEPGRRTNVTKETSIKQPLLTPEEAFDARLASGLSREVMHMERGDPPTTQTPRDIIGTRAFIVAQCGGSEMIADQVEQKAREFFGVEDLDAPMPQKQSALADADA